MENIIRREWRQMSREEEELIPDRGRKKRSEEGRETYRRD